MAANHTSVSGVSVYSQQYTWPSSAGSTIPTNAVIDAYGPKAKDGVSTDYKVQLLPEKNWQYLADGDWVITYTSTTTTHRFVLANDAYTALFA